MSIHQQTEQKASFNGVLTSVEAESDLNSLYNYVSTRRNINEIDRKAGHSASNEMEKIKHFKTNLKQSIPDQHSSVIDNIGMYVFVFLFTQSVVCPVCHVEQNDLWR